MSYLLDCCYTLSWPDEHATLVYSISWLKRHQMNGKKYVFTACQGSHLFCRPRLCVHFHSQNKSKH